MRDAGYLGYWSAAYLLVTPPDETQPITVAWGSAVCSHGYIDQTAYAIGTGPTD